MASGEICDTCVYKNVPAEVLTKFDQQPSLTVAVRSGSSVFHVRREIDPETREKMITDPWPAIKELAEYLAESPCEPSRDGHCRVADFAVYQLLNKQI